MPTYFKPLEDYCFVHVTCKFDLTERKEMHSALSPMFARVIKYYLKGIAYESITEGFLLMFGIEQRRSLLLLLYCMRLEVPETSTKGKVLYWMEMRAEPMWLMVNGVFPERPHLV